MATIYVKTRAYNAEPYIARAIESILNQTHTDWVYYLCNNGSTDKTGEIIEHYAAQDSRIKTFHNQENWVFTETTQPFLSMEQDLSDDTYCCILDADDEYLPNFMAQTLRFAQDNRCELVLTAYEMHDVPKEQVTVRGKIYETDQYFSAQAYQRTAPFWLGCVSHVWATLYTAGLAKKYQAPAIDLGSAADTYQAWEWVRHSEGIGFISTPLYRYYQYGIGNNTISAVAPFNPQRPAQLEAIIQQIERVLEDKIGELGQAVRKQLANAYLGHLSLTLSMLHNSTDNPQKKLAYLTDFMKHPRLLAAIETSHLEASENVLEWCNTLLVRYGRVVKGKPLAKALKAANRLNAVYKQAHLPL